jgi:acyl phosphate:glycerol-3-phosphate acyltransferase
MLQGPVVVIIAYLLGSLPFGYLIVRATKGADIRETGSGGTGATNVSRRAGKTAGVVTLLLDALKGAAAILIASYVLNEVLLAPVNWWVAAAAVAVVIGHMFPVWLSFRGGKGVATAVGVLLVLAPLALALAVVVFFLIVLFTRYVSLGSLVAALLVPVFLAMQNLVVSRRDGSPVITTAVIIALLIVFAHRANIQRLASGNESKFR